MLIKLLIAVLTVVGLMATGCSKKKSSGVAATVPGTTITTAGTYYLNNSTCYNSGNVVANSTFCQTLIVQVMNGRCYNRSTNQQVDIGQCITGTYFLSEGQCYDRIGTIVSGNLCIGGITGNPIPPTQNPYPPTQNPYPPTQNPGGYGGMCYGDFWYWDDYYYDWSLVRCNGYDCSGYELMRADNYQWVYCP